MPGLHCGPDKRPQGAPDLRLDFDNFAKVYCSMQVRKGLDNNPDRKLCCLNDPDTIETLR